MCLFWKVKAHKHHSGLKQKKDARIASGLRIKERFHVLGINADFISCRVFDKRVQTSLTRAR